LLQYFRWVSADPNINKGDNGYFNCAIKNCPLEYSTNLQCCDLCLCEGHLAVHDEQEQCHGREAGNTTTFGKRLEQIAKSQ
jgi:hypothetical protein